MKKPARQPSMSDDQIQTLLKRYACPVPFHQVSKRFLGRIASPAIGTSPMEDLKGLWGGNVPEFESLDAANELIGALVMGLWNQLTRHQERGAPFRLVRMTTPATRQRLAALASTRQQELDGFVEGLFGQNDVARSRGHSRWS